jgi:tetratricopeptide (TPR) repeat protein
MPGVGPAPAPDPKAQVKRQLDACLSLAKTAEPKLFGREAPEWMEKLDSAHKATMAALDFALENDLPRALVVSALLWRFWTMRGYMSEVRPKVHKIIDAAAKAGAPPEYRMPAAVSLAIMDYFDGDEDRASRLAAEYLPVTEARKDELRQALLLMITGWIHESRAEYPEAQARLTAALQLLKKLNHTWGIAVTLRTLGELARMQGDLERAAQIYQEDYEAFQKLGDHGGMGAMLINQGMISLASGDLSEAESRFLGGSAMLRNMGITQFIGTALFALGCLKYARREFIAACHRFGAAQGVLDRIGGKLEPSERAVLDEHLSLLKEQLGEKTVDTALDQGRKTPPDRLLS